MKTNLPLFFKMLERQKVACVPPPPPVPEAPQAPEQAPQGAPHLAPAPEQAPQLTSALRALPAVTIKVLSLQLSVRNLI
jgi:hypothetical protein